MSIVYSNKSIYLYDNPEQFIKDVESKNDFNEVNKESLEDAFDMVGLYYDEDEDIKSQWERFKERYAAFKKADELLQSLAKEEEDGWSHAENFFESIVPSTLVWQFRDLWMSGKKDAVLIKLTDYIENNMESFSYKFGD